MVTRKLVVSSLACVVFACVACGRSPVAPTTDPVVGTWSGTIQDAAGSGTVTFVINQGVIADYGTWTASFPALTGVLGGTLSTSPAGTTAPGSLLILGTCPAGFASFDVTVTGSRVTGTYFAIGCVGLDKGTVDLTRR
jgi:hypothetical protein